MRARFTIYFQEPFWVGVAERESEDGGYEVARVVFGEEPTDAEVLAWSQRRYRDLVFHRADATPADAVVVAPRRNPKRAQREAAEAMAQAGVSSRAQDALREALAARKLSRRATTRAERDAEVARRFALRQAKRRKKHRGR